MNFKILVVDDSAMSRRRSSVLESDGYAVVSRRWNECTETYHLEQPDLLLDMLMKGMYGLDVLAKLREMDANARVVIVTADIQNSTKEMAIEGGALGFVNKPFAAGIVLETVAGILGEWSQQNGIDGTSN